MLSVTLAVYGTSARFNRRVMAPHGFIQTGLGVGLILATSLVPLVSLRLPFSRLPNSDGTISFRNRFAQFKSIDDSIVGKNRNQFDRFDFWANIDRRNR